MLREFRADVPLRHSQTPAFVALGIGEQPPGVLNEALYFASGTPAELARQPVDDLLDGPGATWPHTEGPRHRGSGR